MDIVYRMVTTDNSRYHVDECFAIKTCLLSGCIMWGYASLCFLKVQRKALGFHDGIEEQIPQ